MKKKIIRLAILLLFIICTIGLIKNFYITKPDKLNIKEVLTIESAFGVKFPENTSIVKAFYNHDGWLYCLAEFDMVDVSAFQSKLKWFEVEKVSSNSKSKKRTPSERKSSYFVSSTIERYLHSPYRRVRILGIGTAVRLKWWAPSRENIEWVHSRPPPSDPGGRIDILLEKQNEKIRAYMVYATMRRIFPSEIKQIFPAQKGRWNVRQSNPFPMKDGKN